MTSDVSKSNLVRCNMMQEWIQTLQILCNVILSLIGKGGILVSILAAIGFYNELKLLDHYQNVIVNVFLAYSVVLTAIGWFGIFTGLRNYDRLLYTNAVLLGAFLVTSTVYVATTGIITDYTKTGHLYKDMRSDMKNYNKHDTMDIIDTLQTTLLCCGLDDITTWNTSNFPKSCCRKAQSKTECILGSPYLQTNGCFEEFLRIGRYYAWILFTVVAACGLFEILAIILSHVRYQVIKDRIKKNHATQNAQNLTRCRKIPRAVTSTMQNKRNEEDEGKKEDNKEETKEKTKNVAEKSGEAQTPEKKDNEEVTKKRNLYISKEVIDELISKRFKN